VKVDGRRGVPRAGPQGAASTESPPADGDETTSRRSAELRLDTEASTLDRLNFPAIQPISNLRAQGGSSHPWSDGKRPAPC